MDILDEIVRNFAGRPEVEAVALGGSRAAGTADANSDYDVYVYLNGPFDPEERKSLLSPFCSYLETANRYWEEEDDGVLHGETIKPDRESAASGTGTVIELIYRTIDDFASGLRWTVSGGNASCGYTTCMWNNLLNCKVLFDRNGRLAALKAEYSMPYPEALRTAVVHKNRELLDGRIPSYYAQIEKAAGRGDLVSVNHRVAAFLASYFDVIFAWNRQTHPGEKRLVERCKTLCQCLPFDFEKTLNAVLCPRDNGELLSGLRRMIARLDEMMKG